MKKRLAIIGLGLAVAVGVGAVVYWALTPTPGVTVENFKRLHKKMTMRQVEALLGTTEGITATREHNTAAGWTPRKERWIGTNCEIKVYFWFGPRTDSNMLDCLVVTSGECATDDGQTIEVGPSPTPLLDRIRGWFGI